MQGKVADLSSSTMKKMTEELRSIEADIMAQLTELKRETRTPLRVYIYKSLTSFNMKRLVSGHSLILLVQLRALQNGILIEKRCMSSHCHRGPWGWISCSL